MYVRVAEITSQSSLQFKMLMAFIENELLPRNIKAGQLSGEIFRTSDNSCFVISRFTSKTEANKIMSIMKTELEEMKGSNKIKMIVSLLVFVKEIPELLMLEIIFIKISLISVFLKE